MPVLADPPPRPAPEPDPSPPRATGPGPTSAGPRLAALPGPDPAERDGGEPGEPARPLARGLAAVRKLHGARRRTAWRQRLVDAERGLVLGFRRDGVLAGHVFVLTLAVAAGVVFELNTARWCVLFLALSGAMAAELFGQVLATLAAALMRATGDADSDEAEAIAAAVRLCSAAVAVAATGACGALVAIFTPAVVAALGG